MVVFIDFINFPEEIDKFPVMEDLTAEQQEYIKENGVSNFTDQYPSTVVYVEGKPISKVFLSAFHINWLANMLKSLQLAFRRIFSNQGNYSATKQYYKGDLVSLGTKSFLCLQDCLGISTSNTDYWRLMSFSPTVTSQKSGKTTTLTITDVNGTKTTKIEDGKDLNSFYGTCDTAETVPDKIVSCAGFTLSANVEICIKFTKKNVANNFTLNINNSGVKPVYYKDSPASYSTISDNTKLYHFMYVDDKYVIVGNLDNNTVTNVLNQTTKFYPAGAAFPATTTSTQIFSNKMWFENNTLNTPSLATSSINSINNLGQNIYLGLKNETDVIDSNIVVGSIGSGSRSPYEKGQPNSDAPYIHFADDIQGGDLVTKDNVVQAPHVHWRIYQDGTSEFNRIMLNNDDGYPLTVFNGDIFRQGEGVSGIVTSKIHFDKYGDGVNINSGNIKIFTGSETFSESSMSVNLDDSASNLTLNGINSKIELTDKEAFFIDDSKINIIAPALNIKDGNRNSSGDILLQIKNGSIKLRNSQGTNLSVAGTDIVSELQNLNLTNKKSNSISVTLNKSDNLPSWRLTNDINNNFKLQENDNLVSGVSDWKDMIDISNDSGDVTLSGELNVDAINSPTNDANIYMKTTDMCLVATDNIVAAQTLLGCSYQDINSNGNIGYWNGNCSWGIETNGNASFAQVTSSNADYAKYFEWFDDNKNKEDRAGRFVTLNGDKIVYANSNSDFILGIISATPSLVDNTASFEWQGKYLKDVFGRYITEKVVVPAQINEDGTIVSDGHTEIQRKLNPEYDATKEYIPRKDRPEWDAVGLKGNIIMVDDGTCVVNSYAKPSQNGIATHSEEQNRFRVMRRIDDSHIEIFMA